MSREKRDFRICIEEELGDLVNRNTLSALIRAFTSCYNLYKEGKEDISYVPEFSRVASKRLSESFSCNKVKPLLEEADKYLKTLFNELNNMFDAVFTVNMTLTSRLAIYTKNPFMPLEIAIAWDPVLNLPYTPSSSLKGAVRAWLEVNNVRRIDGVDIDDIFGRAGEKEVHISLAIFTDAYPVSCVNKLIEPDVISPHYKGEDIAEVDVNPVPLVFPTIAPGTTMRFLLALRYRLEGSQLLDPQKAVSIAQHVVKALESGIGAKTSVGYGRVKPVIAESKTKT
ncbi:MAG: type III-B CRISPR module RAMP protein Cmr6 [Desulfurococcaceae archaeon]|nr:type III-B CRISPR module RAMP protein Cmr6 [Desulfurococcaceae archaeon]